MCSCHSLAASYGRVKVDVRYFVYDIPTVVMIWLPNWSNSIHLSMSHVGAPGVQI